ncbi:protein--protein lipoyl transferase, partial [Streptococcus suis]|nr:protein--protein lipoyl transferase [Streptococcus suis]
ISAYISVSGNQVKRGQVVADFYVASFAPQEVSDRFPQVNPDSMANLSDLVGQDVTVEDMKKRIEQVLVENGTRLSTFYPSSDNMADFMTFGKTIKQSMEKYGI